MEARRTDQILMTMTASAARPHASSMTVSGNSTTSHAGESDGKNSSGETSRIKRKQSDRLTIVKRRAMAVVIAADIILLLALAYQMIWLNESLHGAFQDKITDLTGFLKARYQEQLNHLMMGSQLYTRNVSTSTACLCLRGIPSAQSELHRRLGNDLKSRELEIAVVTDPTGVVVGTGGSLSGLGTQFNPQNLVAELYHQYPTSIDQLLASVMVPREMFLALQSTQHTKGHNLRTWIDYPETLTRVVLAPLLCGTDRAQGYFIWGDAWYPSQYDKMNRLAASTTSSLVGVLARSGFSWQMQYSFNKGGKTGWAEPFPDLLPYFTGDELDQSAKVASVQTGLRDLGGVTYMYGMRPIPKPYLGDRQVKGLLESQGVMIYAEPIDSIRRVVNSALWWNVPVGVCIAILSFVSLYYAFQTFLNPMRLLIESVKKKKLTEFNERIRKLKQSQGTLRALLLKTLIVQGALLSLIFVNRMMLSSSIYDITSATTKGRIGPYIAAAQARATAKTLNGWTGFTTVINATASGIATAALRSDFKALEPLFEADAIYLLTMDSRVLASTYQPSEGLIFPEIGLMEYFNKERKADLNSFLTLTSWHPLNVNLFTAQNFTLSDPPALIRLAIAPVNYIYFNASDDDFVIGDLVGALVVARVLNGYRPLWRAISDAFDMGYYGIYQWDRFHMRFSEITSMLKTTETTFDVDISTGHPDLIRSAIGTSFEDDAVHVQDSIVIHGQSSTVSVAPYFSVIDDVVLSPLMMNAYMVTGVPQDRYDALMSRQLVIQTTIMVVELLTSMVALAFTYWPLRQFVVSLEKAFNVPSLSLEKRQKMEERASIMLDRMGPGAGPNSPRSLVNSASRVSIPHRSSQPNPETPQRSSKPIQE